jgi:hypothetical protein
MIRFKAETTPAGAQERLRMARDKKEVSIDRSVFQKTELEKSELKVAKRLWKKANR